ncbi:MAG: L,D-transpeptidase family protein [Parafilimonas sp.]|nr:L,D-transpeptidase family protein [Parafilimonas sp.]
MLISTQAQPISSFNNYLQHNNQVVFVKTNSDSTIHGMMFLCERKNAHKQWRIRDSFNIVVGTKGLGKDATSSIGLNNINTIKHEGDGKSPAGIFSLGSVFSYHTLSHLHMPFVQVDTNFYCVDDVSSNYYNTLINQDTAQHNFSSFEYMKRNDELYEYGVWVLYNSNPVVNGNGSCIFLHVWRNEYSGTAGCTAMAKDNVLKLIYWLNKKKHPVLLQIVSGN